MIKKTVNIIKRTLKGQIHINLPTNFTIWMILAPTQHVNRLHAQKTCFGRKSPPGESYQAGVQTSTLDRASPRQTVPGRGCDHPSQSPLDNGMTELACYILSFVSQTDRRDSPQTKTWGQDLNGTFDHNNSIFFPRTWDIKTNKSPDFGAKKPGQTINYISAAGKNNTAGWRGPWAAPRS